MWTVLVTLDVPTFDEDFSANLTTFLTYLKRHHAYMGLDNQTKAIWEERISVIQNSMKEYAPNIRKRTRRGLINIIGTVANKLFGTATEDEVAATRKQIEKMHARNTQIVHVVKQLVTVVNQTFERSRNMVAHIRSLQTYVTTVAAELSINSQAISDQTQRLDVVKAGVQTDRALALIETTHNL